MVGNFSSFYVPVILNLAIKCNLDILVAATQASLFLHLDAPGEF